MRTPSAIVAMAAGKRWDDDAEEWIHYDLDYEKLKLLPVSDEVGFYAYIHTNIHTNIHTHTHFILVDSIQSDVYIQFINLKIHITSTYTFMHEIQPIHIRVFT